MKKKQLVAVFVMMLAAATMATACQPTEAKAKDALKYLDEKYSDEQVITLDWSAGSDYDSLTYDFLENFKVNNGFEMEVYADEALTDLQDQNALELAEGNNDFWIVVFKAGKDKDDKSAHVFKVNIHKPVTVDVTTVVNGVSTVIASVEENSVVPVPTAPTLPVQKKFMGWYMDETFLAPYDEATTLNQDVTLYAKIVDNEWTTDVNVMLENVENENFTAGTPVSWGFVGAAEMSEFTHVIPGFTLAELEEEGSNVTAYYVRNTFTVSLTDVEGVVIDEIAKVKYGAIPDLTGKTTTKADDGETYYTFDKWVNLDDSEIKAITGDVTYKPVFKPNTYTYTIAEEIEGVTITINDPQENYVKGASVSFTLNIDADYNRSEGYTIFANGTAVTAEDGVYTFTVPGGGAGCDVVITAEGIVQNEYGVSLSAFVVNKDADFALIESETDVILKVDDEEVKYTDLSAISLTFKSGEHKIELIANDVVYYSETVVIEAGQQDVELDDVYLGYFDLDGLTNTANGQINGDKQKIAFFNDLPTDADEFRISYTVKNEWDRMPDGVEQEPSPGYGWAFDNGNGTWMNVLLLDKNIMISYDGMKNGWDPIFTGYAFSPESILAAANGDGLKLDVMKKGEAIYFYIDGNLEFALTEEGFVSVTTSVTLDGAKNSIIGSRVTSFLTSDTLKVGQFVTMGGGKYVPFIVNGASFTTDADKIAAYNEYGVINIEIVKDDPTLMQAQVSVDIDDVNVLEVPNALKGATVDLNDYFMIGKDVTIKFGGFFTRMGAYKDLDQIIVYSSTNGEDWDEGLDITDSIIYVNSDFYKYTFTPAKGVSYKFEIKVKDAADKYASNFVVKTKDDGNFANGINFNVYKENGNLVYSSVTSTVEDYNGSINLPVGKYTIEVETFGNVFGKVVEFEVVDQDVVVEIDLDRNIWGTNWTGVSAEGCKIEYNVDSSAEDVASTFSVTRSGYHNGSWEKYNLAEKLGDGEIISYTMKFNEGHALYVGPSLDNPYQGEDTYLRPDVAKDFIELPSDMYFQSEVGGNKMGLTSKGTGIGGKVLNPPTFSVKGIEGAYMDMSDPDRYDLEYNIMYARVDGKVYMFAKLSTETDYTLVSESNWTFGNEELAISLVYSARGGHQVNITYKDFGLEKDAQEDIRLLVQKTLVGDCLFNGTSGTATVNGEGELVSLTGGTISHEQNGDFIAWDTSTIGDVTNGKFFIEGNFSAWGGYNSKNEWKRHQGAGFVLKQMATGKMITIEPSYQTNSELLIQVSEGNGWNTRAVLPAKNAPTGENAISFQTEAVASKTNPAKYYMRAEVEGYVWKIWIGKDETTIDFSEPTWEVDMYAHLSTAPGGHGSGSQWSGNSNEIKNREDKFPFIADTSDGKYKAEGSDAWSAGSVCMGYVAFGDAGTAGGCIVSNGSINYVSYDDITAIAKSEALAEIEEYAQSLNFTLTDVEKAPVTGMKSYKDKAKAIEEAKALIYFTDYKADAFVTVSAYAQEQGVVLSEEESAYINGLIEEATTKDEVDAGVGKAISLIDAEKATDGTILGIAVKVDEAKEYVADTIASTKEKGITDYAKNKMDEFEVMAMEYLDSLYNLETIDQDILQAKTWTDNMCTAVQMKFTVTILDDKGEVSEEIKDVLFGTEIEGLLEGKVGSAKADDKGGLGEYVFDKWSYEAEDGVVGENVEVTPEYAYSYYAVTVSGTAVDYAGNALAGIEVSIKHESGAVYTGVTNESGVYSIKAVLGASDVTWSTPEITDRYKDVTKEYVYARTATVNAGAEYKDGEMTVDVALAYGISPSNATVVTVSGTYSDDLSDATVTGLAYDVNGYVLNPAFRTGAVLKENTYFKFTTNFHDGSDGNPAHNIHNSGKYTTVIKNNKGENETVFADIGLKMVVGNTSIKVNGPSGNVTDCDQYCQDYITDANNANVTKKFTRTGKNPFMGLFENSFRGAGDVSRVLADYEKSDMDIMFVKTTDNHVDVYGKLTNFDKWVKIGDGTVASDWLTVTMGTRSAEFAHNWTLEGIEYGTIDTATGLPTGAEVDAYNFSATNASAAWDNETGYEYELNLSGIGNRAADNGGDNSTAYIYDNTKTYAFGTGKMVVEGDFTVVQGRAGGAAAGITLRDSANTSRKLNVLMRSNGKHVVFGLNDGNCNGARTWNGLDKLKNNANSTVYNTDMVKEWHSGKEQTIHLKYVFDNNTLTVYYDGVKFFSVENLTEFIKTALDTDAVNQYNTKYPTSNVYVGMYFNHENGFGTDRAKVRNFSVTYESNEELIAQEKAEAKKAVTDAATEYGVEANADVLAQIDAVTERGKATALANAEIAKMKFAYDLANEKKTALDALNAYATEIGVAGEIPAGITSLITGVTELGKAQDALVEAKGLLTVYANSPDCWEIIVASTKTLDEKYAAVDQTALTAKGIEDLNAAYETAKSTINALDDKETAQSSANGAISAFEEVVAKVQGTVAVTFGSNDAIDVKYGTVLSAVDASALTATKAEDNYYTYEFKGWKVNDDAVVSDIAVEAEFTAINKVVAVSGKAVDERGTALAGVTVSAVIDVDGKEATASTTTAEDGTYTFNVPVGDKTDITLAKPFYFSKATSYEGIKSEAQAIANAVMPWTWANENSKNANANVLNIKGEAPTTALDSTVDTATLEYNYVGTRDLMSRLETNLAVGEAIQFSFKWNDGQEADQDPFMRMMYGNAAYHINSYGTGFGGMTESGVTDAHRTFDIALGRDLMYGAFTGKVYDFAFVREGTTIAIVRKARRCCSVEVYCLCRNRC